MTESSHLQSPRVTTRQKCANNPDHAILQEHVLANFEHASCCSPPQSLLYSQRSETKVGALVSLVNLQFPRSASLTSGEGSARFDNRILLGLTSANQLRCQSKYIDLLSLTGVNALSILEDSQSLES